MPREFSRSDRVADAILRELALLIHDEVRDPRVGMVNITDVRVSRDFSVAKIYLTFVDKHEPKDVQAAVAALNGAAGFLRRHLAQNLSLRTTPRLTFFHDDLATRGAQLDALIDYALASNKSSSDRSGKDQATDEDGEV